EADVGLEIVDEPVAGADANAARVLPEPWEVLGDALGLVRVGASEALGILERGVGPREVAFAVGLRRDHDALLVERGPARVVGEHPQLELGGWANPKAQANDVREGLGQLDPRLGRAR